MTGKTTIIVALALLLSLPISYAHSQEEVAPPCTAKTTISDVYATVTEAVASAETDELMRTQISEKMEVFVDFAEFGKLSLGKQWVTLDAGQQEKYLLAFKDLLKRTYLRRFTRGETFKVEFRSDCRLNKKGTRLELQTTITSGETGADVDYRFHKTTDTWMVYDIVVDEVSIMRNYRKSFVSVLKKDGFDKLLEKIQTASSDRDT
jgi:phospholipid transport system substrate-binding protein